jgi:hypothetical protein
MLLIRRLIGEKIRHPPNCLSNLASDVWMVVATCSPQARNIARNMYNMSGEEGEGRNMEKVFATWKKCSKHDVWILVATCSPQARNMFATNSQHRSQHVHYAREGGRGAQHGKVFATWKKFSQHGKSCSQHSKHASQHHDPTADMFHDSNRMARNVSDASARIGRPGASSSGF